MSDAQRRRPAIDKVNVKELARAGHLTYRQIAQRLDLPFGTVTRYLDQLRKSGDVPRRAPQVINALALYKETADG